jgi:hypothetical protein
MALFYFIFITQNTIFICKSNVTPFVVQNLVKVDPVPKKGPFSRYRLHKLGSEPRKIRIGDTQHSLRRNLKISGDHIFLFTDTDQNFDQIFTYISILDIYVSTVT